MYDSMVSVSGGAASYVTARLWLEDVPDRDTVGLVFADTMSEDEDLYRFLDDAQKRLNHPVIRISDGRTPWQLFHAEGMIGNTRADLCSRILRRAVSKRMAGMTRKERHIMRNRINRAQRREQQAVSP